MLAAIDSHKEPFSLNTVSSVEQTTHFSDQHGKESDDSHLVPATLRMNPYTETSLLDFLSRPHIISQFIWTNSQPAFQPIQGWSFPHCLLSLPSVLRKIQNFQYFRGNIKLALRVNGTPFHYGRLLLSFNPNFNNHVNYPLGFNNFVHHCSLPHIQIDANDSTVSEMLIPFTLPIEFIDLVALSNQPYACRTEMGAVTLFVLNQLQSEHNTSITCSLFASFEDIHLSGATNAIINPVLPNLWVPQPSTIGTTRLIDYVVTQQSSRDPEAKQKSSTGLVSGITEKVASFAAPLSVIPGIGPIASAISTGASALGGLFKVFGFSKPYNQSAIQKVVLRSTNLAFGTGLENAELLSIRPDDKVCPAYNYTGGNIDDMQISRIVSTPGFIGQFFITSEMAASAFIYSHRISPVNCLYDPVDKECDFTPLAYTSAAFTYWRGSIRYRLQFVCSSSHSCRLRIVWFPPGAVPTTSEDELSNFINAIVDVSTSTDFCFTIPYLSDSPWKTISSGSTALSTSTMGSFALYVVNPLTFTATPVPSISVNVWHSAGPDFQLSRPTDLRLVNAVSPQSSRKAPSLSLDSMRVDDYPSFIPSTQYVEKNLCNSDSVTHLKELLGRSCYVDSFVMAAGTINFNPFAYPPSARWGFMGWFNQMFRYARGSFGLRISAPNQLTSVTVTNGTLSQCSPSYTIASTAPNYTGAGAVFSNDCLNHPLEVACPYNSTQYAIPLSHWNSNPYSPNVPCLRIASASTAAKHFFLFAGDDWEYSVFVGAPQLKTAWQYYSLTNTVYT